MAATESESDDAAETACPIGAEVAIPIKGIATNAAKINFFVSLIDAY
jgi:hypothetical protein